MPASLHPRVLRAIPLTMLRPRVNALVCTLLVLAVLLAVWWEGGRRLAADLLAEERARVNAQLASRGEAVWMAIHQRLAALKALKSFVESELEFHGELTQEEFRTFAAALYTGASGTRRFVVTPIRGARYVYPPVIGAAADGREASAEAWRLERPEAERAIRSREVVLSAPVALAGGGTGLVARIAAFHDGRAWGIISTVLEVEPLLAHAGLEAGPPGLAVAVRDGESRVFHGDPSVFQRDPVEYRLQLPGEDWALAAIPARGWRAPFHRTLLLYQALALTIVGLLVALTYVAASRQAFLSAAVRQRTRDLEHEIAERAMMEESLRLSRAHFSSIVQISDDAIVSFDRTQHILLFNRGAERLFGRPESEVLGQPLDLLLPPRFVEAHRRHVEQFIASPEAIRTVAIRQPITGRRADGSEFPAEGNMSKFEVGGRLILTIRLRDITERLRAEEALRRLAAIVESSEDAIVSRALDGTILSWNRAAERLFGYTREEMEGQSVDLLVPPERRAEVQAIGERIRRGESVAPFETVRLRKDGARVHMALTVSPIRNAEGSVVALSAIGRDISEQRRMEARIRQSQKMEAIGTLAGGVAHDFNNILSVIIGYTEMALDAIDMNGPARDDLKQALVAARRAKDLVHQILVFSRHRDQERKPLALHQVVREGMHLVRASLPATIEIRQDIDTRSGFVMADATQMHQVLMNLCANAEHAMRNRGGVLEVSLRPVLLDAPFTAAHPPLEPGPHLRLRVLDTGHGMTPEVRERIFDPFFTTKAGGEGTGMGLAVVHGIVAAHGGAISVDSAPDQGATFEIYLPAWAGRPAGEAQGPGGAQGGRESILLVDDEEPLVALWTRRLRGLGYRVTGCTSGVDALRTFRAAPHAFDVVITDQTMPHLTGDSLAVEVLRVRADIPIILCTGYSHTITEERAAALGIRAFLLKPCTLEELSASIRAVLSAQALQPSAG
ncbi:MAG: PAS domain S-box protein [Candidatus Methylomirabilales bacterium]